MSSVRANPNYIRRFFTGPYTSTTPLTLFFSATFSYFTIENYEQFLFVHKEEAESEFFIKNSSIKGTHFLVEHTMDDEVKQYILNNNTILDEDGLNGYRVYTFFKKFGKGGGSVENDCLKFAESLAIGKYPYRGSRSFMKDNITENLIGESHDRDFQISNEIHDFLVKGIPQSPYNNLIIEDNINNYANPDIGQCYGMLALSSPGEEDNELRMPYHFACVIFKDYDDEDNVMTNITVEANVGDQSMQLPLFHIYDVGDYGGKNKNWSFHDSWRDSFTVSKIPILKINVTQNVTSSGEMVITKTPPTNTRTERYDKWGFLIKKGKKGIYDYVYKNSPNTPPITIVGVLKDTLLNKNVKIIPKPFEKESLTPNSPSPSPKDTNNTNILPFISPTSSHSSPAYSHYSPTSLFSSPASSHSSPASSHSSPASSHSSLASLLNSIAYSPDAAPVAAPVAHARSQTRSVRRGRSNGTRRRQRQPDALAQLRNIAAENRQQGRRLNVNTRRNQRP